MNISAIAERVEPFTFTFDGEELKGRYYKWKTQTPSYAKAMQERIPAELTEGTEAELAANKAARREASIALGETAFLADTIVEWDLTDVEGGEVLPITLATLEKLPADFTEQLIAFFAELRNPQANPPTASPST